jgi:predicted metal-dependent peptidase
MHEILHVIHKYSDRLGDRDNEIFNVAQDAVINEIVNDTSISSRHLKVPKGGVVMSTIKDMGYAGENITEPIYDFLFDNAEEITIDSSGAGGQGEDDCPSCGGTGKKDGDENSDEKCDACDGTGKTNGKKKLSTTDDHSKQSKNISEIERAVAEEIINNARTRSWGNVSGNTTSIIKDLIATKKIPWQKKIAAYMSKYVHEPGNIYENTWTRRNRRGLPLPGIRKKSKKIIISVDTSGSVSDQDLSMFFSQIEKIIKDYSSITLIQWDTTVKSVDQYKKGSWKNIEISGRGGTCVQDLYDTVNESYSWASVVINFTDGFFSWDFDDYGIPSIWAIINNPEFVAPRGKTVSVVEDSKE